MEKYGGEDDAMLLVDLETKPASKLNKREKSYLKDLDDSDNISES